MMNFRGHWIRDIVNEGPKGSYWWDQPHVPMYPGEKPHYWDYPGVVDGEGDPRRECWDYPPSVDVDAAAEAATDEPVPEVPAPVV